MITSIKDLIYFQNTEYKRRGSKEFFNDLLILMPGCSDNEIERLKKHIPFLPLSYIEIIKTIDINGTILGYFSLSPSSRKSESLIDKLIACYEDSFFPKKFMRQHEMYQIGSNNTDLICITSGTAKFKEGEILYVEEGEDVYNPHDAQIHRLAKDFEQFLIVAGNVNQLHREIDDDDSNYDEKKQEFLDRLKQLDVAEEYYEAWKLIF